MIFPISIQDAQQEHLSKEPSGNAALKSFYHTEIIFFVSRPWFKKKDPTQNIRSGKESLVNLVFGRKDHWREAGVGVGKMFHDSFLPPALVTSVTWQILDKWEPWKIHFCNKIYFCSVDTNPKHQQTNSSGKIPVINNENFYYYLINRTLAFKILAVNPTLKKITKRGKNNKPKAEPASGSFTFYNEHIVIKSWQLYLHMRYSEQFKNWTQFTKLPVFRDWSSTYVSCAFKRAPDTPPHWTNDTL